MATKAEVKALLRGGTCAKCRYLIPVGHDGKKVYWGDADIAEMHCSLHTTPKGETRPESLIPNFHTHSCKHFWKKEVSAAVHQFATVLETHPSSILGKLSSRYNR